MLQLVSEGRGVLRTPKGRAGVRDGRPSDPQTLRVVPGGKVARGRLPPPPPLTKAFSGRWPRRGVWWPSRGGGQVRLWVLPTPSSPDAPIPGPQGEGAAFCRLQEDAGDSARDASTAMRQGNPHPEKVRV